MKAVGVPRDKGGAGVDAAGDIVELVIDERGKVIVLRRVHYFTAKALSKYARKPIAITLGKTFYYWFSKAGKMFNE